MSVIGTAPVLAKAWGVSSPGTLVSIGEPGLNPSARLYGVGSMGLPSTLRGIARRSRARRRPVAVSPSGRVK